MWTWRNKNGDFGGIWCDDCRGFIREIVFENALCIVHMLGLIEVNSFVDGCKLK